MKCNKQLKYSNYVAYSHFHGTAVNNSGLASIMSSNYEIFSPYIISVEWARNIITTIERSRNVIMHSGELSARDVERIGINIRDWITQVGV